MQVKDLIPGLGLEPRKIRQTQIACTYLLCSFYLLLLYYV